MDDHFLIKFGMSTLVTMSFAFQHLCQFLFYKLDKAKSKDKNVAYILLIIIAQLFSIGIIIALMNYAMDK